MSDVRQNSKTRAVWITLLSCAAFAAVMFLALKVTSRPPLPVVGLPPPIAPTSPSEPHAVGSGERESTPTRAADPKPEVPSDSAPGRTDTAAHVRGRVQERRAGPIAKADVVLWLERGASLEPLGKTVSDARGEFQFTSDALARAFGTDRLLRVDVDAGGYQPGSARVALTAATAQRGVEVEVVLTPGARVFGRVVGPDKAPAADAVVTFEVKRVSGSIESYVALSSTPCAADGGFRLGFDSSGKYRVTARAEGIGTAVVPLLELEAGLDRTIEDVVLAGGPPISGRARSPAGEPVPHLELWAIDTNYATEADALSKAVSRIGEDEREDGLSVAKTWTDDRGEFSLSGLRPGHYALRSPDRQVVLEPRQLRYEPGTENVEISVYSPRVIVRVVEADGSPARAAGVRITELSRRPDGTYEPGDTRALGANGGRGIVSFTLDPETTAAVQAFDSRREGAEEIVLLAQNEWSRNMTLTLPGDAVKGRVRFDVLGDDGAPLAKLRVEARSSATNVPRSDLGVLESDENGVVSRMPAGSYHFTIGYAPGTDRDHFVLRTVDPVLVQAGIETVVSLRARRGGRIEISLSMKSAPKDYESQKKMEADERRERFGSRFHLSPASGGTPIALTFKPQAGPGVVSAVLPAEALVSDTLIEPGSYDLAIQSGAFVLAGPVRVEIAPGVTARAAVAVMAR